jgi:hypothetical protein
MVKAFGEETEALRIRNTIPVDNSGLIAQIKATKTEAELIKVYEANKNNWTNEVKQTAQTHKLTFK